MLEISSKHSVLFNNYLEWHLYRGKKIQVPRLNEGGNRLSTRWVSRHPVNSHFLKEILLLTYFSHAAMCSLFEKTPTFQILVKSLVGTSLSEYYPMSHSSACIAWFVSTNHVQGKILVLNHICALITTHWYTMVMIILNKVLLNLTVVLWIKN